mmetsp:Transcript_25516/g.25899  ORF Transcript_25516/g.25899 Transcript_25516/m.25899 type:complete len:225 (+) Transcript_25516:112-786(+)
MILLFSCKGDQPKVDVDNTLDIAIRRETTIISLFLNPNSTFKQEWRQSRRLFIATHRRPISSELLWYQSYRCTSNYCAFSQLHFLGPTLLHRSSHVDRLQQKCPSCWTQTVFAWPDSWRPRGYQRQSPLAVSPREWHQPGTLFQCRYLKSDCPHLCCRCCYPLLHHLLRHSCCRHFHRSILPAIHWSGVGRASATYTSNRNNALFSFPSTDDYFISKRVLAHST